jgi:hypothetical protein
MSKNKVVHHNEPYRQLLAWSLWQTDNRPYYDSEDGQVISLRNFAHRHYRKLHFLVRRNATLLLRIAWLAAFSFNIFNAADFKGICVG